MYIGDFTRSQAWFARRKILPVASDTARPDLGQGSIFHSLLFLLLQLANRSCRLCAVLVSKIERVVLHSRLGYPGKLPELYKKKRTLYRPKGKEYRVS